MTSTPDATLADAVRRAADAVRAETELRPDVALILGTGLGGLARRIDLTAEVLYEEIPGFPTAIDSVSAGRLVLGTLAGRSVAAMQGRFHRYEGYTLSQVTFPVRVLRNLGAKTLVASCACGTMRPLWSSGDLMLIADHINLLGDNPLVGPNDDRLGPRFPDMSTAYSPDLREIAREVARDLGLALREGTYAGVPGPNLETAAEYRMLRALGADVVGMSTIPEVIVAVHAGMSVLALAVITDSCLPDALTPADTSAIGAAAAAAEPDLIRLVTGVLERWEP